MDIDNQPLVSISCITYNHELFIRQCLDGFIVQECDFDFEILIHDDASTDGTQEIIKEYQEKYPDIIKPIFQTENQYSKGVRGINPRFNYPRAIGKYIALCEGDDYWTDPLKLQKQVDFLEANEEYIACFHKIRRIRDNKTIDYFPSFENDKVIYIDDLINNWCLSIATLMFRQKALDNNFLKTGYHIGDKILGFNLAKQGLLYYSNEVMTNYRFHDGGITSNTSISWTDQTLNYLIEFNKENDNRYNSEIVKFIVNYYKTSQKGLSVYNKLRRLAYLSKVIFKMNPLLLFKNLNKLLF
ncbi:MAG TPA: glycosyltransferase [Chitinophagales bacterium]|nr:glycosyltransferase [Chitinophagales bacterium]